ncbi:Ppx/GppA phosphatase family protein [Phaeocystidibacter luteus]|uniref:Exopolyphosphatase n=1 Tax=Phaeocystidibacter luteus TaxID=911197 RepID=A0A6N6RM92_9FLAO|nr:exopolyphosphatase [Phaeocystidibacter luteus]KAB2814721.1 exopolyphosphatase [Phaeocystidibacter luteus]
MKLKKLAAIDIGSNSIRLLITNVIHEPSKNYTYYKKSSMTRLPIRLGADSFTKGKISEANRKRMLEAMVAYRAIMDVHGVQDFRACATSAMREASNGDLVVEQVKKQTGIEIEIIDGMEEARLIFESKMFDRLEPEEDRFLYIDVGGGSTELTVLENREIVVSRSFKIGTVRLLNEMDDPAEWKEMKKWIEANVKPGDDLAIIASGGNINKLHKMSGRKLTEPLTMRYLNSQDKLLSSYTRDERVTELGLNFDRADVIVHALRIYKTVMQWSHAKHMYVPKIGVSDGIVRDLYHRKYRRRIEK